MADEVDAHYIGTYQLSDDIPDKKDLLLSVSDINSACLFPLFLYKIAFQVILNSINLKTIQ